MVKKKEKKKGWDYSVRWESEDKRKEVVEHRKKKEEEGLSVLSIWVRSVTTLRTCRPIWTATTSS